MALPALSLERSLLEKDRHTEEEYFALEDASPVRWEFVPDGSYDTQGRRLGEIRAMSGGTIDHSGIAMNLGTALTLAFRSSGNHSCRPHGSDLKVHCPDGRNTYPDVSVVCSPAQFYGSRRDVILNPVLLAKILSLSTSAEDYGEKWSSYQTIPTLQHYLLIAADRVRVEMYTRQESGWRYEVWDDLKADLPLPALGVILKLAELYDQVDFRTESPRSSELA